MRQLLRERRLCFRQNVKRSLGQWPEIVCADSTRDYIGRAINLPQAEKPDF
jgi:hypothetical protein